MAPPRVAGAALALLLTGCARETYDVADLQIDVGAPLPAAAETLRLCVSDHGTLERGAGNGRMAFPGIRAGEAVDVTIDVYDDAGALQFVEKVAKGEQVRGSKFRVPSSQFQVHDSMFHTQLRTRNLEL